MCTAAVIFVEPQLNVIMKRNWRRGCVSAVLDAEDYGRGGTIVWRGAARRRERRAR